MRRSGVVLVYKVEGDELVELEQVLPTGVAHEGLPAIP